MDAGPVMRMGAPESPSMGFGHVGWGLLPSLLLLGACTAVTRWDVGGSWDGLVTLTGEAATPRSSTVTDPRAGEQADRIRLCELETLTFSLHFVPIQEGLPAAIEIRVGRPLCQTGRADMVGGSVLVWTEIQPETLAARPSSSWTVSGHLDVDDFDNRGLPELDVGESATVETLSGSLALSASDGSGGLVLIEEATFELQVIARKFERTIS